MRGIVHVGRNRRGDLVVICHPPRVNINYQPYAREGADGQAVVCPLLRGSSATRGVAPNQHRLPRVNINYKPYARGGAEGQAVVCPLLRGRSPTRGVAPKRHRDPALTLIISLM